MGWGGLNTHYAAKIRDLVQNPSNVHQRGARSMRNGVSQKCPYTLIYPKKRAKQKAEQATRKRLGGGREEEEEYRHIRVQPG